MSRRIPSRRMSPLTTFRPGAVARLTLAVLALVVGYVGLNAFASHPWITGAAVAAVVIGASVATRRERRRLVAIAHDRRGESICQFSRGFNTRVVDTWVIRAVYEQIQKELEHACPKFPVRAEDEIARLANDPDALDLSIAPAIAQRIGCSMKNAERNPLFGRVHTAGDLVLFFNAQPHESSA